MTDQPTPSVPALFAIVGTWALNQDMPPQSFWEGSTDEWTVRVNATHEVVEGLAPFHIGLIHKTEYAVMAYLGPGGGHVEGACQDAVFDHFNALLNEPLELAS